MDESIAVCICTYGPDRETWNVFAKRALESVLRQTRQPDEIIRLHRDSLAAARNEAARVAQATWVLFVDADDEIAPGYVEAMLAGTGDLRYPMVQRVDDKRGTAIDEYPMEYPQRPIANGNFLVIGTMMPRAAFLNAGGFREMLAYEDWDLFCRLILWLKLQPMVCRDATYFHHIRKDSRNQVSTFDSVRLAQQIRTTYQ